MTTIFTIGYEGTDIQRFIRTLLAVGVEVVADVRAVPHSRKPGFGKKMLVTELAAVGIGYQHFGGLGDPKEGRDAARAGDYDRFRAVFSSHMMTEQAQAAFSELASLADRTSTCLLCFERDPEVCHRSIVGLHLNARGMKVFDLFSDEPSRYVRHAHLLPRHNLGEGAPAPK